MVAKGNADTKQRKFFNAILQLVIKLNHNLCLQTRIRLYLHIRRHLTPQQAKRQRRWRPKSSMPSIGGSARNERERKRIYRFWVFNNDCDCFIEKKAQTRRERRKGAWPILKSSPF